MTQETATLRVQRGGPDDEPSFDEFAVPHREGMSVLDALIWVRANTDCHWRALAVRMRTHARNAWSKLTVKRCTRVLHALAASL